MRSRCVAIRVSALAVGGSSGKLPSSPGSATRRARRLRAGYGVVGQHGQEGHPRTDLVPVLLGHHPCGLSEVPQVVYHPGREQLPQRHAPQARVLTGEIELPRGQLPGAEELQIRGTQPGEFGEQGFQGAASVARPVAESIVGLEAGVGPPGEHDPRSRDPVGLLTVDQMPHDIERTERFGTFRGPHPRLAQAVEQRAQRGRRASQQVYRQIEIEFHDRDGGFISSHSDGRNAGCCHRGPSHTSRGCPTSSRSPSALGPETADERYDRREHKGDDHHRGDRGVELVARSLDPAPPPGTPQPLPSRPPLPGRAAPRQAAPAAPPPTRCSRVPGPTPQAPPPDARSPPPPPAPPTRPHAAARRRSARSRPERSRARSPAPPRPATRSRPRAAAPPPRPRPSTPPRTSPRPPGPPRPAPRSPAPAPVASATPAWRSPPSATPTPRRRRWCAGTGSRPKRRPTPAPPPARCC